MVWALASLVSQHNTILKVRRKDTGELVDIDLVSGRHGIDSPGLCYLSCCAFCMQYSGRREMLILFPDLFLSVSGPACLHPKQQFW